jgi:beta-lactamase regulating signal transducer with metallopeptidase domain
MTFLALVNPCSHDDAATQSPTATTTFATPVSTSGVADATASIDGVSSISSATPSTAQTSSSSSPTSTSLGGNLVPSDVTEDPSTQTLTTYANAVGDEPKSPPHTEESDVPAIIGATLGAVGIVILVFLLVFCFRRRQRKKELRRRRPDVLPYKRDLDNDDGE